MSEGSWDLTWAWVPVWRDNERANKPRRQIPNYAITWALANKLD